MTTKEAARPDEAAATPPPRKRKWTLLAVLPALVLAAGAAVILFGGTPDVAASAPAVLSDEEGPVIEVDTLTVNLIGEEGRYARIGFAVVLSVEADRAVVGAKVPLMRDAALTVMTDYSADELQTAAGIDSLRTDLSRAMGDLFPDGAVIRAVLTELVVQ